MSLLTNLRVGGALPIISAANQVRNTWNQLTGSSPTTTTRAGTVNNNHVGLSAYRNDPRVAGPLQGNTGLAAYSVASSGGASPTVSKSVSTSGGSSGSTPSQPTFVPANISGGYTPGMDKFNYDEIQKKLDQLLKEYAGMKFNWRPDSAGHKELQGLYSNLHDDYGNVRWNWSPEQFQYEDWGGRDPMVDIARKRTQAEIDYASPHWNNARLGAQRDFNIQEQAMNAARARDERDIRAMGEQDFGRLSNMAANMGLNAGQGAMENMYGVMSDVGRNLNDTGMDYSNNLAALRAQLQNELGGIRAEETGMRASAEGRAQALADDLAMQDFERYMAMRGQRFGEHAFGQELGLQNEAQRVGTEFGALSGRQGALDSRSGLWSQFQDLSRGAENDRLGWLQSQLQGREGVLGAQAGLIQDARDFQWNDWWRNKDFNYTQHWDNVNFQHRNWADNRAFGEDTRRYEQDRQDAERQAAFERMIHASFLR